MSGLRARFAPRMEIRLFENRVRVTNLETGGTIERAADIAFSSDRMLVADARLLCHLLRSVIIDLEGKRWTLAWPSATIHPMGELSPVERHVLTEMGEALGFAKVAFAD